MTQTPIVYRIGGGGTAPTLCPHTVPAVIMEHTADIKNTAPKIQKKGIAVLSHNHINMCKKYALDGVYYTDISVQQFKIQRAKNPHLQLGVFCNDSRHTAMLMGENGADFVVFRDTDCVGWWASLMEIAVIHDTTHTDTDTDTLPIAKGADFVLQHYTHHI